jgi:signal transduction histidine kinase
MLTNLLTNAAKYTDAGGRISLHVHAGEGTALVRVADNGIGIQPEMLPLVFEPFTQLDCARDHAQGGLGIGLALVRKFAQMHGGSITASSAGRGAGSEFTLTLPAVPQRAEAAPGASSA